MNPAAGAGTSQPSPDSTQFSEPSVSPLATTPTSPDVSTRPQSFEDALRLQAAALPNVVKEMIGRPKPTGVLQCGIRILGQHATGAKVYAWLACADYTTGPDATELTASCVPALLTISGTGPQAVVSSVDFPRQQHLQADLAQMFPDDVAAQFHDGDPATTPTAAELLEYARTMQ